MKHEDVIQIKDEIILALLPNVEFDGWTWENVIQSAQEAGHKDTVARIVFPDKLLDVLDSFSDLADREMLKALQDIDPQELSVRERVSTALMKRFEFLSNYQEATKQSAAFWLIPSRKPRATKLVWRSADHIWNWAGDISTDYNRYTKRGLLSGIIVSSTLYWFNSNNDLIALRAFIDRRIENVMKFGKLISRIKTKK